METVDPHDSEVNVVISPHLDDAVLSTGFWMTEHPGSTVVTVCAGLPGPLVPASGWDQAGGFSSGDEAVLSRRREDQAALLTLGARQRLLGFLDGPYRTARVHENRYVGSGIDEAVEQALIEVIDELQPDRVLIPIGWGQTDHSIVSEAGLRALSQRHVNGFAYADLPYAIADPDFLSTRINELQARGMGIDEVPVPQGDPATKAQAISCYQSQIALVDVSRCSDPGVEHIFRLGF